MRERVIRYDMKGELHITEIEKVEGMKVVLVDDKNAPCARYEFERGKLTNLAKIPYQSKRSRIYFEGIIPSSKYEVITSDDDS